MRPIAHSQELSGSVVIDGLRAAVRITRDVAGIPHIAAANTDDLFFAQGFTQAQDRLFQMDLWRRSVQGRLSEVLGANFIERDAMTRRVQYRGPMATEWESYGRDAKAIADAFTRGINAWVVRVRDDPPPEFVLAGWKPELWKAEDLLNRTDAFVASGDAQDEVFRARLIAAIGVAQADALWPPADRARTVVQREVDLNAIGYTVGDLLRRVGTPPFFTGLAVSPGDLSGAGEQTPTGGAANRGTRDRGLRVQPEHHTSVDAPVDRDATGANAWAVSGSHAGEAAPLVAADSHRPFTVPALRYLVHLTAPGWNVIGATAPWLPGVAIGHNDAVAWAMTSAAADVQDLFVEKLNPANERQVLYQGRWVEVEVEHDAIAVKGRAAPFEYDRLYTRHGVIIGLDRERHLAFTLRWSGTEPGTAGELGALALDRAASVSDSQVALHRWKLPAADFVVADRDGHIGQQRVGLVPRRAPGAGHVPSAGWMPGADWSAWPAAEASSRIGDPANGFVSTASGSLARESRLRSVLSSAAPMDVAAAMRLQQDVFAWNAEQLVPLLARVRIDDAAVDAARNALLAWDRRVSVDSLVAAIYVGWEARLSRGLIEGRIPEPLRADFAPRLPSIVPLLTRPSRVWFDRDVTNARDALLVDALADVVNERAGGSSVATWGARHQVTFTHPLAITDRLRERFDVGPFPIGGYAGTVLAATSATGPALRVVFDLSDWDRSVAISAPGQSESPRSAHFADQAKRWSNGGYVPLPFTDGGISAAVESTLTLTPSGR